jgi:uncharacterized damage-inducible protein DinB
MSEIPRMLEQLRRSFEGESWHGLAVLETLEGVTAEQAAHRHAPGLHTIAELVLHMTTWKRAVTERISGRRMDPTPEEDWPSAEPLDAARWDAMRRGLVDQHARLVEAVKVLDDSDLDVAPVGGSTRYVQIHGVVQHDLYHAGQIVILTKLAANT